MSKNIFTVLLCSFMLIGASQRSNAQSTLIHYWNFNSYLEDQYTDTIHGIAANYSVIDTAKAKILYAELPGTSAFYSTHIDTVVPIATIDYDTVNARMGAPSGYAIRVRNPSDSMQLRFYIPTGHYRNIVLKYASEASSTTHGQLHQVFDYSVDSGATWRTSGLSIPSDSAWLSFHLTTVTFTSDSAVNNNPKLVFRIIFSGNTTGISGNNRFDNVTVEGDSIPHSTTAVAKIAAHTIFTLYPNPVTNMLCISATAAGEKSVVIYNQAGQAVAATKVDGVASSINVSQLPAGSYMVTIREQSSGEISTLKFVKQ